MGWAVPRVATTTSFAAKCYVRAPAEFSKLRDVPQGGADTTDHGVTKLHRRPLTGELNQPRIWQGRERYHGIGDDGGVSGDSSRSDEGYHRASVQAECAEHPVEHAGHYRKVSRFFEDRDAEEHVQN